MARPRSVVELGRDAPMDMLLAPVYEDFLAIKDKCLGHGGFVVGPMGTSSTIKLLEYIKSAGTKTPNREFEERYLFDPPLAGVIYESHRTSDLSGGYAYVGIVDEIINNRHNQPYYNLMMKPGEG